MHDQEPLTIRVDYAEFGCLLKLAKAAKDLCDAVSYRVEHGVQNEKAIIGMFTAYKAADALYTEFMQNISHEAQYYGTHSRPSGYDRP